MQPKFLLVIILVLFLNNCGYSNKEKERIELIKKRKIYVEIPNKMIFFGPVKTCNVYSLEFLIHKPKKNEVKLDTIVNFKLFSNIVDLEFHHEDGAIGKRSVKYYLTKYYPIKKLIDEKYIKTFNNKRIVRLQKENRYYELFYSNWKLLKYIKGTVILQKKPFLFFEVFFHHNGIISKEIHSGYSSKSYSFYDSIGRCVRGISHGSISIIKYSGFDKYKNWTKSITITKSIKRNKIEHKKILIRKFQYF